MGQHYPLHHAPPQAQGEPGEERRSSPRATKVSRIQLHQRTRTVAADRPTASARCKERIREQTWRTRGISLRQMVKDIATYLRGWLGYFGDCQTPSGLQTLEAWLRRRLRSVVWKQWKRGRTRFRELRKRGIGKDRAAQTAGSPHGPWRRANSPALNLALPNAYFAQLGLPPMVVRD
jgi:RNA-directed DNA polymerase